MSLDDFPNDVRAGKYELQEKPWISEDFWFDFHNWLEANGVPKKYVSKVGSYAWQEGHGCGLYEVVNCAGDLIEIFKEG